MSSLPITCSHKIEDYVSRNNNLENLRSQQSSKLLYVCVCVCARARVRACEKLANSYSANGAMLYCDFKFT
jgi:hypothetical protein